MSAPIETRHVIAWLLLAAAASADSNPVGDASRPPVDVRRVTHITGDAAAGATKAAVCAACHGVDGNAVVPLFPSLARQPVDYIYLQLESFKKGWRTNPVMQPLVATLSEQDMRDLAAHYASLARSPAAATASADDVTRGKTLYLDGDPARGTPPCQGCHGANATGLLTTPAANAQRLGNSATYPALAGLSSGYVVTQLKAFRDGSRSGTTNALIMQSVAQTLDPQAEAALGDYLATLAIR
jgi:cytochrome c553